MATLTSKREILKRAGYLYNFDRQIYFNRNTKKIFSLEFIEDHNVHELQKCLRENKKGEEWNFYFNFGPSESVKHELESVLG